MNLFKYEITIFSLMIFVLMSACASPPLKDAIHRSPEFQTEPLNKVTFLPVIDARLDRVIDVDLDGQIREPIIENLEDKGYVVIVSNDDDALSGITEEDLKSGDPEIIKQLSSSSSTRRILVVQLIDVSTDLTFGSTGIAEVAGFAYDKGLEQMIWRDKGIGKAGQGGLVGMMMISSMDNAAISAAVMNLMASIPEYTAEQSVSSE
jgi:hypothetical protein